MSFNVITKASNIMGRTGLKIAKVSPEILIGVGIASVIGGGVMACKATLKVESIVIDPAADDIEKIRTAKQNSENGVSMVDSETGEPVEYHEAAYKRDLTLVYFHAAGRFLKLYWPALTLGAVGVGAILGGYNILSKRNVALLAAYKAIEEGYSEYRSRVREELGDDLDRHFRFGTETKDVEIEEEKEDGTKKTKKIKNAEVISEDLGYSEYAKVFDAASPHWQKNPEYNILFLKAQQQFANDILNTRGHLFLNEVYDMLGIPRTSAGQAVGWVKGNGDDFVDFGMYDFTREAVRDFVNGYENVVILDFNVDGAIWDKI